MKMNSKSILVAAFALSLAPAALAQGTWTEDIEKPSRAYIGAVFPGDSDLTDRTGNTHWAAGYAYDFYRTLPNMDGNYFQGGGYLDFSYGEDGDSNMLTAGLGVQGRYYFGQPDAPVMGYVGGGLGVYWVDYEFAGPAPVVENGGGEGGGEVLTQLASPVDDSEIRLGGKLFAGLETPSGFFAEVNYSIIGEVRDTQPGGFGLLIGLRF